MNTEENTFLTSLRYQNWQSFPLKTEMVNKMLIDISTEKIPKLDNNNSCKSK